MDRIDRYIPAAHVEFALSSVASRFSLSFKAQAANANDVPFSLQRSILRTAGDVSRLEMAMTPHCRHLSFMNCLVL